MNDLLDEISEKIVHKEQWNVVKEYMFDLQKENERLRKEIERLKENNQAYQEELCRVWDVRDDLYKRNYKAIEYINNSDILDIHHKNRHDLLKILKGE